MIIYTNQDLHLILMSAYFVYFIKYPRGLENFFSFFKIVLFKFAAINVSTILQHLLSITVHTSLSHFNIIDLVYTVRRDSPFFRCKNMFVFLQIHEHILIKNYDIAKILLFRAKKCLLYEINSLCYFLVFSPF